MRTAEERLAQRVACAKTFASGFGTNTLKETEFKPSSVYQYSDEYLKVAEMMFASFRQGAIENGFNELPWHTIQHGYNVVSLGIAKCHTAYMRHCRQNGANFDSSELIESLLNPTTAEFFTEIANMTNLENREYETELGLRGAVCSIDFEEFEFNPETKSFSPNQQQKSAARAKAIGARMTRLVEEGIDSIKDYEKCPAIKFIPRVWEAMVHALNEANLLKDTSVLESPQNAESGNIN